MTNPQNPSQNPYPNSNAGAGSSGTGKPGNGTPYRAGGDENQTAVWNTNAGSYNGGGSASGSNVGGGSAGGNRAGAYGNPAGYGAANYGGPQGQFGQPGQQGQPLQFGQPGQNMYQQQPQKKSKLWLKVLIGLLLVIVLLVALAEFGVRWFLKDQIKTSFKEQQQESGVSKSVDPEVSLGASPVLLGMLQGKIPQMEIDLPSTLDITYEGQDKSKPKVSGDPAIHMEMRDMKMDGDNPDSAVVGDLSLRTTIPKEMLLAQAAKGAREGSDESDNPLSGFIQLTDVAPNPDKQTLTFELTGGLATFEMKPVVEDGKMKMDMDSASVLGINLPDSFSQQMETQMEDTVPADIGGGLEFDSVNVTDQGLDVSLHGTDVDLSELETGTTDSGSANADGNQGAGGSGGSGGSGGDNSDVTRPWKDDGPVGSSALAA